MIKRRKITGDIEHRILSGLIVSDRFAQQVIPMLRKEYFDSEHSSAIFEWAKDFFNQYKEAPGKNIEDIFKENRENIDDDKVELIKEFLANLKGKYNEDGLNVEYLIDQSTEYIKRRAIKTTAEKALQYLESGKIDKAEEEMQNHRKLAKAAKPGVDPFNSDFIRETMSDEESKENNVFIFPGALGELSGWHERDWLVAVVAPMKRGKSFFLMEMAIQCMLNSKKVVLFSLEMSEKRMEKRILRRIAAFGKSDGEYIYPCFDCEKNQNGSCRMSTRTNRLKLWIDDEGQKPAFDKNSKYKPCTICRGKNNYKVATWFTVKKRSQPTTGRIIRKARSIKRMHGDNLRLKSYPAGSANTIDILSYLNLLEYTENFIPDVIIIDYADILKPEDSRLSDPRAIADRTWTMMKGLADSRHILVITATQGNRKSIEKLNVGQIDISEDIRKLAHIDMMYSLNQTPNEKKENIMRVGVIGHRDEDFSEFDHVLVLQQRALGQVILDSELVRRKFTDETDLSNPIT